MAKKAIIIGLILAFAAFAFAKAGLTLDSGKKSLKTAKKGIKKEVKKEMKMKTTKVLMKTSMGDIELELYPEAAPITVANFVTYAKEGFYNGLVFHRVISNFMIQGGGFDVKGNQKQPTHPQIKNEAGNGLSNTVGTIAMARTGVVNSATSQFFINVKDNLFLNHTNETPRGFGYAVFGKVIKGMDVVNAIKEVKTQANPSTHMPNWPVEDVIIKEVTIEK